MNSFLKDSNNDEPLLAHKPSWANNPDYTLHATTTKPEESTRKPVFGVFNDNEEKFKKEKAVEQPIEMQNNVSKRATKKPNQSDEPTTRL